MMQTAVHSRCVTGVASLQSASCRTRRHVRAQRPFVCSAQQPRNDQTQAASKLLLPVTAAFAAALLVSAGVPDQALAARSGGRVGGSSFRSARPAPSPAPRGGGGGGGQSGPTIKNYNYHSYSAPPVYGGYGPGFGFGGGGISIMPSFGVPVVGGGGFFSLIFGLFAISLVLNVARNLTSRGRNRDDFD